MITAPRALKRVMAALACLVSIAWSPLHAQTSPESEKLAAEIPIADVHFHVETRFSAPEVVALLDRLNVRWAGGVGPIGASGPGYEARAAFIKAMGDRYIATRGQPEFNIMYIQGGSGAMEDAGSSAFRALLEVSESEFKAGTIRGFGELFANNSRSSSTPKLRRKVRADAPTHRALYELAGKYGGFLQFHVQADNDTLEQLGVLAAIEPRVPIILAHCGTDAGADVIRGLLEKHANLHCDLSQKAPPVWNPKKAHQRIFNESGVEPDWLKLIEDFPDRFMIGTDAYCCDYAEAIAVIRKGLLPRLAPATLRKVAHENAQRVMRLK